MICYKCLICKALHHFVGYMGEGAFANNLMNALIGVIIAVVVAFVATMFLYKPDKESA